MNNTGHVYDLILGVKQIAYPAPAKQHVIVTMSCSARDRGTRTP